MALKFDWDDAKAVSNVAKHGVPFEEAATAFGEPLSRTIPDSEHSEEEDRYVLVGMTTLNRLVVVVHTEAEDTIRVISARIATPGERRDYEEGKT